MPSIIVAGAGLAGAVAARELAERGHDVLIIDKRPHIAGNAHDAIDARGVRVHTYGPHLFHTANMEVVRWLSRFTDWLPYEHRVAACMPDGSLAPVPVNRRTIEMVTGLRLPGADAARAALARLAQPIAAPANAEEYLLSRLGPDLTELLYGRYTRKMWGAPLSDLDAAVVQRIPIRFDDEDRYFPADPFQALPQGGYTEMVGRILDHPRIRVSLNTPFEPALRRGMAHSFLCLPIDEYYDFRLGRLPYRSIRFHHEEADPGPQGLPATVNFTDTQPFTRATHWHRLPGHWNGAGPKVTRTIEEPCADHENGFERYYPVKDAGGRNQALYARYAALAATEPGITFMGRCGTYQYLDMHQVVNQTLSLLRKFRLPDATGPAA